jgi:hypothetical protein
MKENFRRLIYVPVLHARGESGHQTAILRENSANNVPASRNDTPPELKEMWTGIFAKIAELSLTWNQTRIYQDGLPVCGRELQIVEQLAAKDSLNHKLILDFLHKGAKLEGTENIDFLLREYDLLNALLMKQPGPDQAAREEYRQKSKELLQLRDEFIFNRIKRTLQEGETPLVFMGVMHRLDKLLETDFLVSYVIYRLPFQTVGAIYNA